MKQQNYTRYFRVFKNDTVITEISTNDFLPLKLRPSGKNWLIGDTTEILGAIASICYQLVPLGIMFYGYRTRIEAINGAKSGALSHINSLIALGKAGEQELLQYRMDHYEDLNVNLVGNSSYKAEHNLPVALYSHLI